MHSGYAAAAYARNAALERDEQIRLVRLNMINAFLDLYTGGPRRPVSFDVPSTCPPLADVTRNFPAIRRELDGVLAHRDKIPEYHTIDKNQDVYFVDGGSGPRVADEHAVRGRAAQRDLRAAVPADGPSSSRACPTS